MLEPEIDRTPDSARLAALLLDWYDRSARTLPWRVSPAQRAAGVSPDPYRVWLSEVMLQQTTVAAVIPYFHGFLERWPTVQALAAAELDAVLAAWAGLGYYARARNLHKCARHVAEHLDGRFPEDEAGLRALPGVGAYTAAAVAAIAFDRPAVVVDGNVERVMTRLMRIETPLPDAKPDLAAAAARLTPRARPGDYAQAVMDLGATLCAPARPVCGGCPWAPHCRARREGVAAELPRKRPKPAKPVRLGAAYVALDGQGRVLLQRRPESGLLGGMLGLPGGAWSESPEIALEAPFDASWRDLEVEARHTFTHFHLRLGLFGAVIARPRRRDGDLWIARESFDAQALPTVMKKALSLGLSRLDAQSGTPPKPRR